MEAESPTESNAAGVVLQAQGTQSAEVARSPVPLSADCKERLSSSLALNNTTPAGVLLSVGNNNASTTFSGTLTGSGSLTKLGTLPLPVTYPSYGQAVATSAGGTFTLTASNTYTGATTVSGGIMQLAGTGGGLGGTSGLTVSGNAQFIDGDATVANNNGVSNRVGSAAGLTLGSLSGAGTFTMALPSSGSATSQSLATLTINPGLNVLNSQNTGGTASLILAGGAGGYVHNAGGLLLVTTAAGFAPQFTAAPTGSSVAGSSPNAILVGALLNGSDFLARELRRGFHPRNLHHHGHRRHGHYDCRRQHRCQPGRNHVGAGHDQHHPLLSEQQLYGDPQRFQRHHVGRDPLRAQRHRGLDASPAARSPRAGRIW